MKRDVAEVLVFDLLLGRDPREGARLPLVLDVCHGRHGFRHLGRLNQLVGSGPRQPPPGADGDMPPSSTVTERTLDECVCNFLDRSLGDGYWPPVVLPDDRKIGNVVDLRREGRQLIATLRLGVSGEIMTQKGRLLAVRLGGAIRR